MRKHFYLITEHEREERVGGVSIYDSPMRDALKDEEGRITVFDKENGEFNDVGKKVGLGYHDFDDEADYEARVGDVLVEKIQEVDRKWAERAGVAEEVYDQ